MPSVFCQSILSLINSGVRNTSSYCDFYRLFPFHNEVWQVYCEKVASWLDLTCFQYEHVVTFYTSELLLLTFKFL